ncbi:MAG: RNA-binding domain-containing protein [Candidatus Korarchaeum sp.]
MGHDRRLSLRVTLEAEVYPTEDERKVIQAMKSIVPFNEEIDEVEVVHEGLIKVIRVRKEGYDSLSKLRNSLRSNRILDTARSLLLSKKGTIKPLRFHKQAAMVGRVNLVDDEEFSPLGVIVLRIDYEGDPTVLADWLAPRTERGRPVCEVTLQELLYGRRDES